MYAAHCTNLYAESCFITSNTAGNPGSYRPEPTVLILHQSGNHDSTKAKYSFGT